jgi:hypothetical protein
MSPVYNTIVAPISVLEYRGIYNSQDVLLTGADKAVIHSRCSPVGREEVKRWQALHLLPAERVAAKERRIMVRMVVEDPETGEVLYTVGLRRSSPSDGQSGSAVAKDTICTMRSEPPGHRPDVRTMDGSDRCSRCSLVGVRTYPVRLHRRDLGDLAVVKGETENVPLHGRLEPLGLVHWYAVMVCELGSGNEPACPSSGFADFVGVGITGGGSFQADNPPFTVKQKVDCFGFA